MRVIFAGTPDAAVMSLRALIDSQHEVVAVITRPDARSGRGRDLRPSPVALAAYEAGIEVLKPPSPSDAEFRAALQERRPDCCPVVAYGALIPADLLSIPRHGWVNLHFSLLPAWRGAAPVQHALLHGDDVTGATTFRLSQGLDSGPVFGSVTERIEPDDTSGTLLDRLARVGAELLLRTLDGIEAGGLVARDQPTDGVSLAPKITTDDSRVRWTDPALAVDRRIRACTPHPGAWSLLQGDRIVLGPVDRSPEAPSSTLTAPGALTVTKHEVWVGTGSAPVRLGAVKPAGRREMTAADWARGARLRDGLVLA